MKALLEMVFIGEIVFQIKIAQRAAKRLEDRMVIDDSEDLWSYIQTILTSTANVSRILWPPRKQNRQRGQHLRKLLKIDDSNILSDRTIRNHFEHYDERIERWFNEHPTASYIDLAFTAKSPDSLINFPRNYHRSYDQISRVLNFRGETLDLGEVLKALGEVRVNCGPYGR